MQIVRTIVWVLILVGLLAFSLANWSPVEVKIWDNLILETKVPALVIVSFLLGLIPMWLLHRGAKWRATRRISALESAAQARTVAESKPVVTAADVDPGDLTPEHKVVNSDSTPGTLP